MHKRKDDIRDIYQGSNHDFEKDFTPQIDREILEERRRDLRRSRIVSLFFGSLMIVLAVMVAALVIHSFLNDRSPSRKKIQIQKAVFAPRYAQTSNTLWIMDYRQEAARPEEDENPGPKPFSTGWVKKAAYHIVMGQQALALNAPDQALEQFQKAVGIYPDIEGVQMAMGQLYLDRRNYPQAVVHLEKALQEEESFEAVNSLGKAYIGTEEYSKAEASLKKALSLRPESPECHKNLAGLYRKMKRDNEAVFHFEKYIDLQPGDLETMQTYALYLTRIGRWKDAADFLTKLTQEVTDVAPVFFLLAQVQVQNGQPDKAVAALQRGIQLVDPQLALAWLNREEFNAVRHSGEFKNLVDKLQGAAASPDRSK